MDEEIKNELLSVLREMRSGAPGVWQELVAQRAQFCFVTGCVSLLMAIAAVASAAVFLPRLFRWAASVSEESAGISYFVPAVVAAIHAFVFAAFACESGNRIAESYAPLGRILGMLR